MSHDPLTGVPVCEYCPDRGVCGLCGCTVSTDRQGNVTVASPIRYVEPRLASEPIPDMVRHDSPVQLILTQPKRDELVYIVEVVPGWFLKEISTDILPFNMALTGDPADALPCLLYSSVKELIYSIGTNNVTVHRYNPTTKQMYKDSLAERMVGQSI